MALYAFDGTWKEDYKDDWDDTNVVWFRDAYHGETVYLPGVGTRMGWLGRVIGGLTGAGGQRRVREALEAYRRIAGAGDAVVDVVGFSRGAALALHFANSLPAGARVRFVGLFDTVASFGVPGNNIDILWNLSLPRQAERVYHAMALDETRLNFPLHRLEPNPRLTECWFRGVHSDVGGGNDNAALSSVALDWMFECAHCAGLNLRTWKILENRVRMNPFAPTSEQTFTTKLRRRTRRAGDAAHPSIATM